jgi:peptide/nickel transport system substrate-binding protein
MASGRRITRRGFLGGGGGLAAAALLAACGATPANPAPGTAAPTTAAAAGPSPTTVVLVPPTAPPARVQGTATRAVGTAAAPAPTTGAASTAIKRGGQLQIMQINDFVSMDPIYASGPTASAVYESLLGWRPNAQGQYGLQPQLAESYDTSGTSLTFKLRPGVKFHDGSDLTAEVVAWNIARMVQDKKSFAANYLQAIDRQTPATVVDPLTVRVNLTRPSSAVLTSLSDANTNTFIVSKKIADEKGAAALQATPVGTGPFKFVSFNAGDKLVVTKNENYWQKGADGKPLPYVDGITYRVIIEATTQFNEMRAGTADLMANVPGRNVPAAKQIATARYIDAPFNGVKRQFFFNALKPPFKDNLPLRQAVQYAIDRDAIAKALGAGLGVVLPYELVPGQIGYSDQVPAYTYDPEKAKALLQQAGVTLPVPVRLTVHNREVDQQQAQLIQQMLDKVGVKITLDVVERTAWGEKVRLNNDFEMATRQAGVLIDPTDDLLITWAEGGNSAYSRAKVPGLIDTLKAADAEYDQAKRQELFVKAQTLMYESAWMGYMWFEKGNFLVNKRVQGFPDSIWGSYREKEWSISQ